MLHLSICRTVHLSVCPMPVLSTDHADTALCRCAVQPAARFAAAKALELN